MSKDLDLSIDWQEHQRRSKAFAEFIKPIKLEIIGSVGFANLEEVAYDSSLGGSFELRTKDALPKIFEILDNYGVKVDETK